MRIMKRSGEEHEFNITKIIRAVEKANAEVPAAAQLSVEEIRKVASNVEDQCLALGRVVQIEEIQDMVENELMKFTAERPAVTALARAYITYRYKQGLKRQSNTTDDKILGLVDNRSEEVKEENANKNSVINSTQRDYIAGEVSRDLTRRILMPPDVIRAHDEGIIHVHDTDYHLQHMHNCFHSKTKFVTSKGIKSFSECHDGQIVEVLDKDGIFREATVHKYGSQPMQRVTFAAGRRVKEVVCTPDHRWILEDGSVTTELKIGDYLWKLVDSTEVKIQTKRQCEMFALGALIADGCDHIGSNHHEIRLCGEKVKWASTIERAGYDLRPISDSDDIMCVARGYEKQRFLDGKQWKFLSTEDKKCLFYGLMSMDGAKHKLCTADERIAELIRDISAISGWHISSEAIEAGETNFSKDRKLYAFHMVVSQPENLKWKVVDIKNEKGNHLYEAWCVEEPITHSFTLEGGMATGNCDLINLEDMLQNGTVISGTKIDKPKSFGVAANVTTQIIAQVASNQYGGQTISLSHLAPFVDVSRQKIRKNVKEEFEANGITGFDDEAINRIAENRLKKEIANGVQTIQYQLLTLLTTNGF